MSKKSDSPTTTKEDASRIQSSQDKAGRDTGKNTFASRSQSAADRNGGSTKKPS